MADELRISADQFYNLDSARSRYAKRMELYCNGQSNAIRLKELFAPYRSDTHVGQGDSSQTQQLLLPGVSRLSQPGRGLQTGAGGGMAREPAG